MAPTRILFCGGGTGGHVAPGVAVAEALREDDPGVALLFAGPGREVEKRILAAAGIDHVVLPQAAAPRLLGLPRFAIGASRALLGARRLLREFAPDAVIALGGYGSVAPALAARTLGIPLVVLEQNAVPGRATRLLARFAECVHVPPVAGIARHFPKRAELWDTGNPIRRAARVGLVRPDGHDDRDPAAGIEARRRARRELDLPDDPRARVLLVLGGSQGAQTLNDFAVAAAPAVARALGDRLGEGRFAVLHLAGNEPAARACREAYAARGVRAVVRAFDDRPGRAYAAADLALSRSGAGVLAELAAAGVPAVLVPLPGSARDHQRHNAIAHREGGAAVVVEQQALGLGTVRLLARWLGSDAALRAGARAARALGKPRAAAVVAASVAAIVRNTIRARGLGSEVRWETVRSSA